MYKSNKMEKKWKEMKRHTLLVAIHKYNGRKINIFYIMQAGTLKLCLRGHAKLTDWLADWLTIQWLALDGLLTELSWKFIMKIKWCAIFFFFYFFVPNRINGGRKNSVFFFHDVDAWSPLFYAVITFHCSFKPRQISSGWSFKWKKKFF